MNKKRITRIALVLSIVMVVAWGVMGTGTSLAWFTDTDEEVNNIFNFAEFELEVEFRDENGNWKSIEGRTDLFEDGALYEPGYTQVVYLRVINNGTVPFDVKTAVMVNRFSKPTNVFGQIFYLQDYLTFGLTEAVSLEAEMDELVKTRTLAKAYATMPLGTYEKEVASLEAGQTVYMALVVHMPEEVDNVANYFGGDIPEVDLGLVITATQQNK